MKNLIISAIIDLLKDVRQYILDLDSAYGSDEATAMVKRIENAITILEKI